MVPSQFGGEGADDVGRDVVRNVVPVFERRVAVVLSRNVHARIVGVEVLHAVARPACALVGHVGRDFEHLRDEFEVERRGVGHLKPVVLLPRSTLGEGRVSALGGGLRPCAVGVLQQRERKGEHVDLTRDHLLAVVHHRLMVLAAHQTGVVVERQPRADADRAFGAQVVLLVGLLAHLVDAVLIVIASRNVVAHALATALNADGVRGRVVHRLVNLLEPVRFAVIAVVAVGVDAVVVHRRIGAASFQLFEPCVRIRHVVVEQRRDGGRRRRVEIRFAERLDPLHGVGHHVVLPDHRAAVQRHRTVVIHAHLAFFGILGRDKDYAECAAGAVNGCRRSILEHRDRGDVVGIHRAHVALGAVDEHQRAAALSEFVLLLSAVDAGLEAVVHAANGHLTSVGGLTVGLHDVQTRNLALKRTGDVGVRTVFHRVARQILDGAHDVALLERTVTHDDHFVHHQLVLLHRDVDLGALPHRLFLIAVADVREEQHRVLVRRNGVAAVHARGDADQRAFDRDRHADHRVACGVPHHARHLRLGRSGPDGLCGMRAARQHHDLVHHAVIDAAGREYRFEDGVERGPLFRNVEVLHRIIGQCDFIGEYDAHLLRDRVGNGFERRSGIGQLQVVPLGVGKRSSSRIAPRCYAAERHDQTESFME